MMLKLNMRNLCNPRNSYHEINMGFGPANDVSLFLKEGEMLSEKESDFIFRLNKFICDCEADDEMQEKIMSKFEVHFGDKLPRLKVEQISLSRLNFPESVKIYYMKLKERNNVTLSEFEKIVNEQHVPVVFIDEEYEVSTNNKIDLSDIQYKIGPNFYEAALPFVKSDIDCYNSIIDKCELKMPIKKQYMCKYNEISIIAGNTYNCAVNKVILFMFISFMYFDSIVNLMHEHYIKAQMEQEAIEAKEKAELEMKVQKQMEELKDKILDDPEFVKCSNRDALSYFKSVMKEYINTNHDEVGYQILDRLELQITKTGNIINRGYKAQKFINDLLYKAKEKR